jgi:hypothetical protein
MNHSQKSDINFFLKMTSPAAAAKMFLKHNDLYKAYNNMPNHIYFYNSKNIPGLEHTDFDLNALFREVDMLRAIDMPQKPLLPPPPPPPPAPRPRQLPPSEFYDEANAYASFRFRLFRNTFLRKRVSKKDKF